MNDVDLVQDEEVDEEKNLHDEQKNLHDEQRTDLTLLSRSIINYLDSRNQLPTQRSEGEGD